MLQKVEMKALSDRVLPGRPELRGGFIDQGYTVGASNFRGGEGTSGEQRNAERPGIVGADECEHDRARAILRHAVDAVSGAGSVEGQPAIADGGRLGAGNRGGAVEEALREGDTLLPGGVALGRHLYADHEDAVGLEPEVYGLHREEASNGEARAD